MRAVVKGRGELFTDPDPDIIREHFRSKDKERTDKLMGLSDAIARFLHDGDYLAVGGFGSVRIPSAALHEIIRQGRKRLGFAGHTATHDFQLLAAGECLDRCDAAYIVGLEARGISPNARRYIQSGKVKLSEWTNAGLAWRLKAAALGIPFLIGRQGLGTDTFARSACKTLICPYTKKRYATFPALSPDVAIIHVHEADRIGNASFRGVTVADEDLSRAAKRVIITCERLVPTDFFREDPSRAKIPYCCVDAVCHVPYGCYPANMPFEYFSDEEHLKAWMEAERDPETFQDFLRRNIFACKDFAEYLERNGGMKKMEKLHQIEFLEQG